MRCCRLTVLVNLQRRCSITMAGQYHFTVLFFRLLTVGLRRRLASFLSSLLCLENGVHSFVFASLISCRCIWIFPINLHCTFNSCKQFHMVFVSIITNTDLISIHIIKEGFISLSLFFFHLFFSIVAYILYPVVNKYIVLQFYWHLSLNFVINILFFVFCSYFYEPFSYCFHIHCNSCHSNIFPFKCLSVSSLHLPCLPCLPLLFHISYFFHLDFILFHISIML